MLLLAYAIGSRIPMLGVVDGRSQPPVTVQESRPYKLFDSEDYGKHVMTLSVPKAEFEAFTFTFE